MKTEGSTYPIPLEKLSSTVDPLLEITTLGGLSIRLSGQPLSKLHSRKAEGLLVYLALTARPQSREVLADLLWANLPQKQAMNNLRVVLSNLRKHLGDQLLITRDTAGMNPDGNYGLDVAVFDANLGFAGESERKIGTLNHEAVTHIERAVELYKGEFLEGFFVSNALEFDAWMVVERERFHYLVLDGLGKLVRWELAQGEYTAGIWHTSKWIQLDPLSEVAHRQMMRLLVFSGQRSAALAQYEKCRKVLATELGLEPESKTVALYEQITAGEFGQDETISEYIPPADAGIRNVRHHNLPVQTTPFIGRQRELTALNRLLTSPDVHLVTVMGAGGMGKTRLVLEAGKGVLDQFPDGVFFVSLAPLQSVELVVPTITQALGIDFARGDAGSGDSQADQKNSLLRNLRRKQMLLILDNFEHLLDGVYLVGDILRTAPDVKILATSRSRLNISGEHMLPVDGMAYPEDIMDDEVRNYSAVRLFLESARRSQSGYKPHPDELKHIANICRLVEGMPLGIRLAASWVGTLSPEEIAGEITQGLDLLETDLRDIPVRHHSIRALYDHSWSLLNPKEQEVFQAFSVFRGGCTRDAAQEITGATLRDLRRLVNASLLQRTLHGRFEIHELSREYAAEKLSQSPELMESMGSRHSGYYNDAVEKWGDALKSDRQETVLTEMDLEIENAWAAWDWAVERHRVDLVGISIEGFRHYLAIRIRWQDAESIFRQAAVCFESSTTGEALRVYARLLSLHGYFTPSVEQKKELYQQSLEVAQRLEVSGQDVRYEKAIILYFVGELSSRSDFEESVRYYNQSLRLFEELGDRYWVADILNFLGSVYYLWGKLNDAIKFHQQSLTNFRQLGDPRKIAHNLGQFDYIYSRQGDFEKAERAARERLEIYERIGDPSAIALAKGELGSCLNHLGEFAGAERLLEKAMEIHKEREQISAFFLIANHLSITKLNLGAYAQANDLAQSALEWSGAKIYPLPGWPIGRDTEKRRMGITLIIQGMATLALGSAAEAELLLQRSSEVLGDTQTITLTAYHHPVRGITTLRCNQPDKAKMHIWDGLNIGLEISSAMVYLFTLGAAALYLADRGNLELAVEIYALATRFPEIAKSQWFHDVIKRPLTTLTAPLSPEIILAAQKRGRERDLEATVRQLFAELR